MIEPRYISGDTTDRDFWQYNNSIQNITFYNKIEEPEEYEEVFDVSNEKDGSVIAYLVFNEDDLYDLYIMADGNIYANPDSSRMFSYFTKLKAINNMEYFRTIYSTNMLEMFHRNKNLISIDVSYFDTRNVTNMESMFAMDLYDGSLLTELDVSNFDTSKVTNMADMFAFIDKLTYLDLKNFDTSNVTDMSQMFRYCYKLEQVDLSNFDTSNVTNMSWLFEDNYSLKNIYVGNKWNVASVEISNNMFDNCDELPNFNESYTDKTKAYVGDGGYLTLKD